jgi:hypothetical protein
VGESGMIRTQMGNETGSVMVAVYGTPCTILPRNNNSNSRVYKTTEGAGLAQAV